MEFKIKKRENREKIMFNITSYVTALANFFNKIRSKNYEVESYLRAFAFLLGQEPNSMTAVELIDLNQMFIPKDKSLRPKMETTPRYSITPMTQYLKAINTPQMIDDELPDFINQSDEIGVMQFNDLDYPYFSVVYYTKEDKLHMMGVVDKELTDDQIEFILSQLEEQHVNYLKNLK